MQLMEPFNSISKHESIGLIVSDKTGIIKNCNPLALKIFGYKDDEMTGLPIQDLIRSRHKNEHEDEYKFCFDKHYSVKSIQLEVNNTNGDKSHEEVFLSHFEVDDEVYTVIFFNNTNWSLDSQKNLNKLTKKYEKIVDQRTRELFEALMEINYSHVKLKKEVSRRKELESQMRKSLQRERELGVLKSRFVSVASHEFRTPLGGILTSASLIDKYHDSNNTEKLHKHTSKIVKAVKNLTSILDDFLSLDMLEQGIFETKLGFFSFESLVADIVENIREVYNKNQKILVVHKNSDLMLYQDENILRSIILNLFSNAIKYSPENSTIYFESELKDQNVIIKIKDKGIGIPKADQKHVCSRFFRGHNVQNIQGTGLGLNIVKNYLNLLGGTLKFISKESKGTTFTLTLPKEFK